MWNFVLALTFTAFANAAPIQKPVVESRRKEVQDFHRKTLPLLLCDSKDYFYQCFPDIQSSCTKKMSAAVADCLSKNAEWIEHRLREDDFEGTSRKIHIKIGSCVGKNFEKKFASYKTGEAKCQSDRAWQ